MNLTHVFNLTDVDDRIINEAKKAGKTIDEFTAPFIEAFWEDFDSLGLSDRKSRRARPNISRK
jgi:cysteinyl-tRNA synthetase